MVDLMQRDWDDRARRNAFHYIASWQKQWNSEAFLASGKQDYQALVAPVLERCGIPATGECMLELGCGAGRMTANFASRYKRILALDVSTEMLSRGAKVHPTLENISWLPVAGDSLSGVESDSVDFVFSYLVLQHMPTEAIAINYILEMLRVLRVGGAFLFQFNGSRACNMNLRGRIAWGLVDTLWLMHLTTLSRAAATAFGFDPATSGKSWRGVAIEMERVKSAIREGRGVVRETLGENTPMTWCCGIKSGGQPDVRC
jgi:ubiquinone/menaquinone biosynthesis C-methylase UbiE